jgi:PAS domain S-box-containing protein
MIRILVADDHEVVRRGICSIIANEPSLTVCCEAVDGRDAIEKAVELQPDLVIMDISMPNMNGLEATREIKRLLPKIEIVIVSQHETAEMVRQAFKAGARGYVTKSTISADLLAAITKATHHGGIFVHGGENGNANHNLDAQEILNRSAAFEKALRESERHFREMIDALPAAVYTTDADGRLTHFNRAAADFSGWTPELGTDKWCVTWKLFRADGTPLPHDQCPMAVALKEGRIVDGVEAIAERPDGTRVWFTPYPRPLHDAEGRIVCGINMLVDITKRKQAEQVTSLLASIVESSDDAIISKSLDGIITSWNKSAERIFGYTAEEAIAQHITLIIPLGFRNEEAKILERLRRGERVDHFETVRQRKDGGTLDVSLTISPVTDSAGRVVGASKVARNITERKQIERALREGEERFRSIVETTPECVKLVSADGTLLHMNSSGLTMVGADSPETVIGKNVYDLIASHDRERFRDFNERVCSGVRDSLEFDLVGLQGVSRHMESHAAPLQMPDGRVVQLAVTRDISERKRVEKELRMSKDRLRELAWGLESQVHSRTEELEQRNVEVLQQSEQLRELSNRLLQTQDNERRHIALELHDSAGQTLTALGMNLAMLVRNATLNAPQLARDANESRQLVQQLSQEIRTASYLLHPPLLDESGLAAALNWYVEGLRERSGLDISFSFTEEFGQLPRDLELAVFRIVQECLTNIHRHSGSKSAEITIARNDQFVDVNVQDQGKGMSSAKLEEIQSRGSGVGIRGIRERLRLLHGTMRIESNGSGTRISVSIPIPKTEPNNGTVEFSRVQATV